MFHGWLKYRSLFKGEQYPPFFCTTHSSNLKLFGSVYISAVNISNTAAYHWTQYWATTIYFLSSLRHFTKSHLNFFLPSPSLPSNWSDQERFLHLKSAGFSKIRDKWPAHFSVRGSCILTTLDRQYEQWVKSPSTCNIGPTNSLLPSHPKWYNQQYTRTHSMTTLFRFDTHFTIRLHNYAWRQLRQRP